MFELPLTGSNKTANMKKLIFSSIFILVGLGTYAQNTSVKPNGKARTAEQRAEHLTNWMNQKLTLTAEQKTKVYDVNLKYAKINQEARAKDADNKKAIRQELQANEAEREAEFKTILTPDQLKAFQAAKEEQKEKRMERRKKK